MASRQSKLVKNFEALHAAISMNSSTQRLSDGAFVSRAAYRARDDGGGGLLTGIGVEH
jgi:hypothetical protein